MLLECFKKQYKRQLEKEESKIKAEYTLYVKPKPYKIPMEWSKHKQLKQKQHL